MHPRFASFEPLFAAFAASGHQLFIVGGCVRDVVMGLERIGDVDLATDAEPEETTRVLESNGFKAYPIGERFGTITTMVAGATVEITTFRVGEVYERGSRHPVVEFGSDIRADLSRRDLSINAMAMDAEGGIIDPFEGRRAIRDELLEVPGGGYENTISILRDDPLRLLRIARFAARFGFTPTEDTTRAAAATAPELAHISRERWKMEMDKLLVGDTVAVGLSWLHAVGGLAVILPVAAGVAAERVEVIGARVAATPADVLTRWAALLLGLLVEEPLSAAAVWPDADLRTTLATDIGRDFRFSNKERKALAALLSLALRREDLAVPRTLADARRFYVEAPEQAYARLDIARAFALGEPTFEAAVSALRDQLDEVLAAGDPTPRLPTGLGGEIRRRFGLSGPEIGAAIARIGDAVLAGELPNEASAETYLDFIAPAEKA